ncbi:phage repressor protein/antirepressor Ant [Listeria monocytogenes]|uniref:Phage repressor protein/antirepressor Ant n=3 Tax=Listeria monocytogenes TaxID=1639 RepID=A0A686T7L8_LISMN|nr:phage repressor protein/antirepressor Ant [Listeria monocytogenes]YP_001468876.1 anti-repressor Ant [Listeria phage A006]EAE6067993.1 phage repressor protein/antirepressor Ant [Listeria monocytogenes serotype 1/2a]EAG6285038.1 phage repressor protein/antirepressor Ant [Listeria monocytogenes CFSAN003810]EAH4395776.1 phage repressor protein/antirepressor Ant [Listeria monocytogenes serotype 3a]EAH4403247.1 phage repressor protein/antirepressor Ant [Listeria monocytogenes serotype 1/2b]MCY51
MSNLQIFNFEGNEVRTVFIENEPHFIGKDVAKVLGYSNSRDALKRHVFLKNKGVVKHDSLGGSQNLTAINEAGLYQLIFKSKLESAERFQDWVTSEVLPSVRKHGAYMTNDTIEKAITDPDFLIRLATNLKEEKTKRIEAEQRLEIQKPKVMFAEAVSDARGTILIRDLAKLIQQNGIDIGEKRLFEWMRQRGYLISRKGTDYNRPTQKSMELGLFKIKETAIIRSSGAQTAITAKVTGKGQLYFVNKFLEQSLKTI